GRGAGWRGAGGAVGSYSRFADQVSGSSRVPMGGPGGANAEDRRGGASMWELICHHTYRWEGLPWDLSFYSCHGEREGADFLADGVEPRSGAVRLPQPPRPVPSRPDPD